MDKFDNKWFLLILILLVLIYCSNIINQTIILIVILCIIIWFFIEYFNNESYDSLYDNFSNSQKDNISKLKFNNSFYKGKDYRIPLKYYKLKNNTLQPENYPDIKIPTADLGISIKNLYDGNKFRNQQIHMARNKYNSNSNSNIKEILKDSTNNNFDWWDNNNIPYNI